MAGKALKASGKRVMKYSRDGAVERNLAESSETRISGRTEDAVLKVEHTDERFNAHGTVPEQPETEQKHRRHNPSDVQEQPQNTENGQSNSDLKFEDKTFKFDDTDIPAPAANEPVPVEAPAADETPAVPDNSEQQPETPQSTVAAQVVADHSDDTDEIPQDSFIIENLFAEFYGSDDAPASGSKSDKFSFRQDEQLAPDSGKKRKAGRLQEDTHVDSKLKAETSSTSLKQDAAKSGLMGDTAGKTAGTVMRSLPLFEGIEFVPDTSKVLNSSKVSDHTAIIPTLSLANTNLDEVPNGEKNILFLIACRLLCAVSAPYIYDTVTAEIGCSGFSFTAKGRTVISEGFKAIENVFKQKQKCKDENEDNADEPALALSEGKTITGVSSDVCENYTQPPKHFTEDTLLSAMERAGTEDITEEVERSGLGTPATRASIIEKLTKSGFVTRDKRNLLVSAGGFDLLSFMPEIIKSAKLTADWENKLSLMAQGKFTEQQFMADIERLVCDIISQARSEYDESKVADFGGEAFGTCPRCGRNILKTPKAYSCENKACGFAIWKQNKFFQNARKELTVDMVKKMLSKGKVAVSGLYSQKSGKTYDAVINLDDNGKYVNFKLEFPANKKGRK